MHLNANVSHGFKCKCKILETHLNANANTFANAFDIFKCLTKTILGFKYTDKKKSCNLYFDTIITIITYIYYKESLGIPEMTSRSRMRDALAVNWWPYYAGSCLVLFTLF